MPTRLRDSFPNLSRSHTRLRRTFTPILTLGTGTGTSLQPRRDVQHVRVTYQTQLTATRTHHATSPNPLYSPTDRVAVESDRSTRATRKSVDTTSNKREEDLATTRGT